MNKPKTMPTTVATTPTLTAPTPAFMPVLVDSATKPAKKERVRTPSKLVLVEITEDVNTHQEVLAVVDLPPLPTNKPLTSSMIEEACNKAVYQDSKKEFGNKQFAVVAIRRKFSIPFIERPALVPPQK